MDTDPLIPLKSEATVLHRRHVMRVFLRTRHCYCYKKINIRNRANFWPREMVPCHLPSLVRLAYCFLVPRIMADVRSIIRDNILSLILSMPEPTFD